MKMILLVMQDPTLLRIFRHHLEKAGHTVFPMTSAAVAIEAMKRRQDFTVVIASQGTDYEDCRGLDALAFAKRFVPDAKTIFAMEMPSQELSENAEFLCIDRFDVQQHLKSILEEEGILPMTNNERKELSVFGANMFSRN